MGAVEVCRGPLNSYFELVLAIKPVHLTILQSIFDNQSLLDFQALPGKNVGPQYVSISTEVARVELDSAD